MLALEPDRIIDSVIITNAIMARWRFCLFPSKAEKQNGNPTARQAAKPAGLSKLPIILKTL